jgi:hypothetical protein
VQVGGGKGKGKGTKGTFKGSVVNQKSPLQAAFSPDNRCLAVVSAGVVTLYELATGQPRRTWGDKPGVATAVDRGPVVVFAPDGKSLAYAGAGGAVYLVDVPTGKEVAAFKGHGGLVNAVAFAPDGKTLASASNDTTALIWDISKVARPAANVSMPQPGDLEKWWQALTSDDAGKAYEAIRALAAAPTEAVAWIKDRVKPASGASKKQIEELVFQLDDVQYKVRYKATSELELIGEEILPVLDIALLAKPPPEMKKRLEELRRRVTPGLTLRGERLRLVRAVEVLELIGTTEARQVLQTLADGAPGALLTRHARAALQR